MRFSMVIMAAAILVAGCGGPITGGELRRGVDTLGATAAEGRLVALGVVDDRTKTTFVRTAARDLADDAQHEAEKLTDAKAGPRTTGARDEAVRLAQDIDAALGDLEVAPADRAGAGDVARRLDELKRRADELAERL
jgi:hypothetical protein